MTFDAAALRGDLFHLVGTTLQPGSVILPGNWGRVVQCFGSLHRHAERERLLEEARQAIAPELPSRLAAAYVFLTLDEAQGFRGRATPGSPLEGFEAHAVYRVRLMEPDAPHFLANYTLVRPGVSAEPWPYAYWHPLAGPDEGARGEDAVRVRAGLRPGLRELLTLSRLLIEERVDDV